MKNFMGNLPVGDTIPIMFDTFDSNGASVTLTGLAVTDIECYKDGSVTQRSSDAGISLLDTDGIDFDSLTGIHGFSIDTSDNTDAGFWAAGSYYTIVVSAVTIDSQTVRFIAASFRLCAAENTSGTPVADTTLIEGSDATDQINAACDTALTDYDAVVPADLPANFADLSITATTGRVDVASIEGADATDQINAAADTALSDYDPPTKAELDSGLAGLNDPTAAAIADAVWDEAQSGHVGAGTFGEIASEIASILGDTDELQSDDVPGLIAALNNISAAQVNAEVVDALNTDTYAEPGQGAPAATASLAAKVGYLYKAWRNKKEQTATELSLYDDAGTTVDQKSTVSDDGTTTTVGEIASGP